MNHLFKPFIKHTFLNKTSFSVSLLFLTILLSSCGGDSTENSTTVKEPETKVVPKKEVTKAEPKKVEPKEEAKPEPKTEAKVELKEEIKEEQKEEVINEPEIVKAEFKEEPLVLPPPPKIPHSKEDMLAVLTAIKIPEPDSVVDNTAKDKEEFQTKMKGKLEKEVKQVIDDYLKLGSDILPKEIDKIKKEIKDTFDNFLKNKDDKWESKPKDNSSPETKQYLQGELSDILKWLDKKSYLEQGVDSISSLTKNRCMLVGVKAGSIEECAKLQIKKDKIDEIAEGAIPIIKNYDTVLNAFLDPEKKLNKEESNLSSYFKVFSACEGTEETITKLIKEHDLFVFKYQKNIFLIEVNKKLLQELSLTKKKMESEVESNTLDKTKNIEVLTLLLDKEKIFISSSDSKSDVLANILNSKNMRYSQKPETGRFEQEVVAEFREKVDSEIPKKFIAVYEMDDQNKLTLEKARLEIIRLKAERDERIRIAKEKAEAEFIRLKEEREARIELAKEKARQKVLQAEEARTRAIAENVAKLQKAQADADLATLEAKAEKIRKSNKLTELDSYELALLAYPPTLGPGHLAQTSDLSTLKGKITSLTPAQCLQSAGGGKALMKCSYFNTPILIEALNPTFANTVYVDKRSYVMLIKFTGTTSYKNLLGGETQAVKAQVIYVRE